MKSGRLLIEEINGIAELERLNWDVESCGDDEYRVKCPAHDDSNPSAVINTRKNLWSCKVPACGAKGTIVDFIMLVAKVSKATVLKDLSSRYDLDDIKEISGDTVLRHHSAINNAGSLLEELKKRGITREMIVEAKLGFFKGRITIPVYDEKHRVVNIRRYLPGAASERKMRNTQGYGKLRLYRIKDLSYDTVWICGGELKALVVGHMLNPKGIGAVSATAGEGNWDPQWSDKFKGKNVFICMDVDMSGRVAANKVANLIKPKAASTKIITLPLDKSRYPKGDVNDFVGSLEATVEDLIALQETAKEPTNDLATPVREAGVCDGTFDTALDPGYLDWRITFEGRVSPVQSDPRVVPRIIAVKCDRDQPGCAYCPVSQLPIRENTTDTILSVSKTAGQLMALATLPRTAPDAIVRKLIREALGIPLCKTARFVVEQFWASAKVDVQPPQVIPEVHDDIDPERKIPALYLSDKLIPTFESLYKITGVPRASGAGNYFFIIDQVERSDTSIAVYKPTKYELESLSVFRPDSWTIEGLERSLEAIYNDMSVRHTKIYGEKDLHLAVDLAFFSPLFIKVEGDQVKPGWVNLLIVGDTSVGKSEVTSNMARLYERGDIVDCKAMSIAGIIGGVQQSQGEWTINWGAMVTNSGGLLILEESKGIHTDDFGKLTQVRSTGIADIRKIKTGRAPARTRLITISNPRFDRAMREFAYGIEAIPPLVGAQEDVRRFDLAFGIRNRDTENIRPPIKRIYDDETHRTALLISWTLKPDEIDFSGIYDRARSAASKLTEKYHRSIALLDSGSTWLKLLRLSAALAARTGSYETDTGRLLVRKCHLDYIVAFIHRIYDSSAMQFDNYSKQKRQSETLLAVDTLAKFISNLKKPALFKRVFSDNEYITKELIEAAAGVEQGAGSTIISVLLEHNAIVQGPNRTFKRTPQFLEWLRTQTPDVSISPNLLTDTEV